MIHVHQTVNRKALYIYQKFYTYSIWILAFGMLTTLAEQLKEDLGPTCTYKQFLAANSLEKNHKKQCKTESTAFQFSYKIFKAYFKEYILPDENDYDRAREMSLDLQCEEPDGVGDLNDPVEPPPEDGATAFGVSNFFGFNIKKR